MKNEAYINIEDVEEEVMTDETMADNEENTTPEEEPAQGAQLVEVLEGLDDTDYTVVLAELDDAVKKITEAKYLPMSYSSFEHKMAAFAPKKPIHQWMSVYSKLASKGYSPEMIYTTMELIARVCYTCKPIASGLKLDSAKVPPILIGIYDIVCAHLRKNALAASIKGLLTKIGKSDTRLRVITQGLITRIDSLDSKCEGKKTITRDSAQLLPLLKPFGIDLRQSITNARAYDGWGVLDGNKAGDVLEASLSFGINLPSDRVDAVLGWAARSNTVNIQAEILNGLLAKYKYDGKADYIQQMADCIPTVESDSVKVASIRFFLQRMVQVIRNPELQGMVLGFKGKKGCGKSTLAAWLFSCLPDKDGVYPDVPNTVEGLHGMSLSPFYSDQRADFSDTGIEEEVESLSHCFGRELAELSLTQKDWNRFKAAVTSRTQAKRRKYDKYATSLKTVAGMISSMDHISLSEADTHRLLLLTILEGMMIDLARLCKIPSGMVIAQAVWEIDNGKLYKPDAAMMEEFAKAQLGAVEESSVEAIIESNFYIKCSCLDSKSGKELCAVPVADMTAIVRDLLGRDPGKGEINRVLEQHGIKKTATAHKAYPGKDKVSCWVGVYPTADCILRAVKSDSPLKQRMGADGLAWDPYDKDMSSRYNFACAADGIDNFIQGDIPSVSAKPSADEAVRAETAASAVSYTLDGPVYGQGGPAPAKDTPLFDGLPLSWQA